jgi:hypothetical protein
MPDAYHAPLPPGVAGVPSVVDGREWWIEGSTLYSTDYRVSTAALHRHARQLATLARTLPWPEIQRFAAGGAPR